MNYRELKKEILEMSDEQLDMPVAVFDGGDLICPVKAFKVFSKFGEMDVSPDDFEPDQPIIMLYPMM